MDREKTWPAALGTVKDPTVPGADAGFTQFINYNTLRAYVQDWRRVSKGFQYPEGTSEAPEPSYKVYVKPNITHSYYSGSLSIKSVSVNGSDPITDPNADGYYVYDFGKEHTNSFTITLIYTYKTRRCGSTNRRTKTETVTDEVKSDLYIDFNVTSTNNTTDNGSLDITSTGSSSSSTFYYYWPDSREEKKNDVYQSLIKATTATDYDRTIYINSLCGYFIDSEYPLSYKPDPMIMSFIPSTSYSSTKYAFGDVKYGSAELGEGYADYFDAEAANTDAYEMFGGTEGNIAEFATWMNGFFYNKLLEIGANNLQGSTGIILCDRISGDPNANPAGYYINQIIIANNFKQHGTNSSAGDNMNTGGGSEDNSDSPEAGVAPRKTFGHNKTADNSNTLVSEWK